MRILVLIPILMLTARLTHAQEANTTAAPTTVYSTKRPGLGDCNATQALQSTRQIGQIFEKIRGGIPSSAEVQILECTLGCQMLQAYSVGTTGLGVVFGLFAPRVPKCIETIRDPDGTVDHCEVPKCVYNIFYRKKPPTTTTTSTTTTTTTTTTPTPTTTTTTTTTTPSTTTKKSGIKIGNGGLLKMLFG